MAGNDLVFSKAPLTQPANLLFGETDAVADFEVSLAATLPAPTLAVAISPVTDVTLAATLPGLTVAIAAEYRSECARPTIARVQAPWQGARPTPTGEMVAWHDSQRRQAGAQVAHQQARKTPAGVEVELPHNFRRDRSGFDLLHSDAARRQASATLAYANMLRGIRPSIEGAFQRAEHRETELGSDWQDRLRNNRPSLAAPWQEAQRAIRVASGRFGVARPFARVLRGRYQEAVPPAPGRHPVPAIPGQEPCYTPPAGNAVGLLFDALAGDGNLIFVCERATPEPPPPPVPGETIVIPVRSVYIVVNNATLTRVADGMPLTAVSMSLSIDADSWTWGFSATLPADMLPYLQPDSDGTPVELEATVNGQAFRVLAEGLRRTRTFGKATLAVSGRGKSALLADPIAPVMTFANTSQRTAQQLMNDALTVNGVPIGWTVDWQITDWLVPAGVWNLRGSYIDAVNAIAAAAGAYIQPDPVAQTLRVLARYPSAPWNWSTVTPDVELPAAVTQTEGIEWKERPRYNRVFVSGTSAGVLAQVTRSGTPGDVVAPMVTDALITEAAVGRMRGIRELSDTGRQALVSLKTPVLAETGIIVPGKFVRYVDGADTRLGIVRGVNVDVARPETWQSLTVETHE